jgi:hypothetical protein
MAPMTIRSAIPTGAILLHLPHFREQSVIGGAYHGLLATSSAPRHFETESGMAS